MGLWNDLTGKSDADKANKKAERAHQDAYAKARQEEYNATLRASQLSNALMMSNMSETMAGKGVTEAIKESYIDRMSSQQAEARYNKGIVDEYQADLDYRLAGGGVTRTRGQNIRWDTQVVNEYSSRLNANTDEIDRISGILGIVNN